MICLTQEDDNSDVVFVGDSGTDIAAIPVALEVASSPFELSLFAQLKCRQTADMITVTTIKFGVLLVSSVDSMTVAAATGLEVIR